MARDNSPQKRSKNQLARKKGRRASYDRILIVTEGSKTEPNYFKEIQNLYSLHTANVAVKPSKKTNPIGVVEYAQKLFEEGDQKKIQPRAFERVYAVFDRDDHECYRDALESAEKMNGKLKNDDKQKILFKAITSVPCFELWLLLHYEDIRASLNRKTVMTRLKKHIPKYKKNAKNTFSITRNCLDTAIERAKKLGIGSTAHSDSEPFTNIFELVELLIDFKKQEHVNTNQKQLAKCNQYASTKCR